VFWNLLRDSRLLAPEQVQQLSADFGHMKGAAEQGSAKTLSEWLVARNVLSKYQTMILLAGRAGPFFYGDYKVYDRVDKGRLAGQFRAVHAPTGHPVLLQFLTGPIITDQQLWAAAANDVLAASSIVSPHVQRFFEPVDLQAFKFLVSEDLRGDSLEQRLSVGRYPPHEAARIVRLAAIGLAQMHQCGRVHGDLRPANVLLESIPNHPGNVRLLFDPTQTPEPIDFNDQQAGSRLSLAADYLAPELMSPGRVPDPLADIYALGCLLYAMLTGAPPFAGGNVQQKMTRHASEPVRPLEQFGVPQPLAQLAMYLMAKNPAVRYQSAAIVAEQISAFVDPQALYAPPPGAPATLPGFEQFVRQKHAQLAAPKRPATPAFAINTGDGAAAIPRGTAVAEPVPGIPRGKAAGEGGLTFQPGKDRFAAVAAVAGDGGTTEGPKVTSRSAEEIMKLAEQRQRKMLIGGLVAVGLLAISGIVALNMLGRGGEEAVEVAEAENHGPDEEPQPLERVDPSQIGGKAPAAITNTSGATVGAPGSQDAKSGETATNAANAASSAGSGTASELAFVQQVVPDDGKLLWASPTAGKPVSFRCVPPEAQLFLIVRPAEMIASGEGDRVLQSLGPTFPIQREAFETASGFKLDEIEQLILALHNNDAKFPRVSLVVKPKEKVPSPDLLAKWGNPAEAKEGNGTYYTGPAWSYYIAPGEETLFLMGEARDVKDVAKAAGAPPVLFREIERLRRTTDDSRHVTLLFYPQFLFNDDGEPLFAAERAKVRQPLSWLLGDHLQAAAVSLHFGEDFYFETRMLGSLDKEPYKLASELKDRLNAIPTSLEDYFVALTPPPYWKKLAFRYPAMIRDLHSNMRVGVESDQAIVNSLLPGSAAHNLVLGGELLVSSAPGTATAIASAGPPAAAGPKTIEEALELRTTYNFASQSLEFAMRDLAADVKDLSKGAPFEFEIKIIGTDLEKDGITRNQSVRDFDQQDKTVAEILTALVRKANPITTVKDPSELDQKLIWVIGPDPDSPNKRIVLITTRAAAATKKYTLPAPFVPKAA
jgi:hypothetical protein